VSAFYVAQWSVAEPDTAACEAALVKLAEHIHSAHHAILSVRTFRQAWGPAPRRAYVWYEEFSGIASLEAEPETPACAAAWRPIHALALDATFTGAVWTDPQRSMWFER
jgi:hypothetical protein